MSTKAAAATHVGDMRFDIVTGSGHPLATDDGHGDQAARPTELVAAALATCTGMDVIAILRKKRQEVTSYVVRVEATQRDAHPQVFTRITVTHEIEGTTLAVEAVRRSIELSATKYCPVNAMLSSGVTKIRHQYVVHADGTTRTGHVVTTGPGRKAAKAT